MAKVLARLRISALPIESDAKPGLGYSTTSSMETRLQNRSQ